MATRSSIRTCTTCRAFGDLPSCLGLKGLDGKTAALLAMVEDYNHMGNKAWLDFGCPCRPSLVDYAYLL